uniref:Uncharacterized protein n=1 Tax=Schistocephalus solidus TaxID=70667 RepID=A0A0V0JD11_SCHSO
MWWATKVSWVNLPICIKVIWIYFLSVAYANSTRKPLNISAFNDFRARLWNLHGAQDFYPCAFKRSAPDADDLDMIECDQKASQMMENIIPTIYPDNRVVREVRINLQDELTFIPAKAFEYVGPSLYTLTISGGRLRRIRKGAFFGLTQLRKLNITDVLVGERSSKGTAHRLFSREGELATLTNLRELILQNVDLSDGLGPRAFIGISIHLEAVRLVNNRLRSINETAFEGCPCAKSIKRLAIEQQPPKSDWIKSLRTWAKDLKALEEISLNGNDLSTTKELDFGETVNKGLRVLRIENCSLTSVGSWHSLSLERLGEQLRELYVGGNLFDVTDQNSKEALIGLARFDQLDLISFAGNRGKMNRLPNWLGNATIKTLDLSRSYLQQIGPGDLPRGLKTLRLQASPLQELKPMWSQNTVGLSELFLDETVLRNITVGNISGDWTTALKPLASTLQTLSLKHCELISEGFASNAADFEVARTRIDLLGFSDLRKVVLSRNCLTYIPSGTFQSVRRLRELHVRDNLLQSIEDPNWSGEYYPSNRDDRRMHIIDLTNNAITTLSRCAPALGMNRPLEELLPLTWEDPVGGRATGLKLTGNPLICDCRLGWLSSYVRHVMSDSAYEASRAVANSLNFTCIGRGRWAGKRFLQLTPKMLQQEMHPDCYRHSELYGEISKPICRTLPPPTQTESPVDAEETEDTAAESLYIFRPVRIFGYDAEDHKLWLAVRPDKLKRAWKSIARQRSQIDSFDAVYMEQILPIARISHLPPQTIIHIKENYAIFQLLFWPVERQDEAVRGPITWYVTAKGADKREYIFSAQPVFSTSAYTVCLRDALAIKTSVQSTICQIFQPSEILGKIKLPTEPGSNAYESGKISMVWLWVAAITVSILLLLIVLLLLILCLYRRKRKRREKKKRLSASSAVLRESKHRLSSSSATWVTDSIYAKIHGSPAGVSLLRDSVKQPARNDENDGLYEMLEDFNAGDTHHTGTHRGIGSPSRSESSMPNLSYVDGYHAKEAAILVNQLDIKTRRRASSNLPELPRRTPKPDGHIRFRVFGGKAPLAPAATTSASTGDLYHSGCGTPRPTSTSRRFIPNTPKATTSGWRTSLTQKIRRSTAESGPGARKGAGTGRKSKSPSPPDPIVSGTFNNEWFERSPKCTISSPKLPPPFPILTSEKDKQGSSTEDINTPASRKDSENGYLPMQLSDVPSAPSLAQTQQQLDAYQMGAGEAQLTDSYILGASGISDFMQSCATGKSSGQVEAGIDKRPDTQQRQLPPTVVTTSKLYSQPPSTGGLIVLKATEKTAPLCLPEVDSPIENCDSSP